MTRLLIVTGVSCAGKTTLGRALAQEPDVADWIDLDEHATEAPVTGWSDWLRWRAATVLHDVTGRADGRLYVVSGIVWPFRVVESTAWRPAMKAGLQVGWLLLDPPWKTIRERLAERCAGRPKADRRELYDYNRGLRRTLREQVAVFRNARLTACADLPTLVRYGMSSW